MTPDEVEALVPIAAELIGAACAGHPEPLWDAMVEGENEVERVARQTRALSFCRRCPQKLRCAESIDIKHDDGIRAGIVLPTIPDHDRRAVSSLRPGRGGIALLIRETSRDKRETSRSGSLRVQDAAPHVRQHGRAADPDGTSTNPGARQMLSPANPTRPARSAPRNWGANPLQFAEVSPYAAKFYARVNPGHPDECWTWTGQLLRGYGQVNIGYGKDGTYKIRAHRMSWVLHTGRDLPADTSIDHLCRTPSCVNPNHLEPVTIHENRRRAKAKAGSPEAVEAEVQRLLIDAEVYEERHPRGQIRRLCPLCQTPYGTDYLADHIRRHVVSGAKYRGHRVRPRDGSAHDLTTCPDCGKTIQNHMRRHQERMHGVAS